MKTIFFVCDSLSLSHYFQFNAHTLLACFGIYCTQILSFIRWGVKTTCTENSHQRHRHWEGKWKTFFNYDGHAKSWSNLVGFMYDLIFVSRLISPHVGCFIATHTKLPPPNPKDNEWINFQFYMFTVLWRRRKESFKWSIGMPWNEPITRKLSANVRLKRNFCEINLINSQWGWSPKTWTHQPNLF